MGVLTTKPSSLQRGTSFSLAYSRVSLKTLINDAYFGDDTNWKKVVFYYKDATGSQKTYVAMDNTTNTGTIKVSTKARGNTWQLYKVLILDLDGGSLIVQRASLGSSDDIVVSN